MINGSSITFLIRALIVAALSPASLIKLAMRFLTVFLVIMHYQFAEKIDYFEHGLRQNEMSLLKFIVIWHWVMVALRVGDER
jgi:hypothetical protein